jgi:hypothetical protein
MNTSLTAPIELRFRFQYAAAVVNAFLASQEGSDGS